MEAHENAPSSNTDQHVQLRDGRRLGYAEYGAADGKPVFFFHGMPGSRLFCHPDGSILHALGVRIVAPDRPGIGLSDYTPGYTLLDWPDDVAELAGTLGIERFAVAGYSGGGPYAAACAFKLRSCLTAAAIVSGVGPLDAPGALEGMLSSNRLGYQVGRWMGWSWWRLIFRLYYGGVRRHPERLARMSEEEPRPDHVAFAQPGVREMLVRSFAEAFRQGTAGVARDGWLLSRPWGFGLEAIETPVFLWQGEEDVVVMPAMGRRMAAKIPGCQATFLPGEGHLLFFSYWRDILTVLTSDSPSD
jgi:pimeloyl-ACP methyl ester carboxylesterase